jgi:hypothetical protein
MCITPGQNNGVTTRTSQLVVCPRSNAIMMPILWHTTQFGQKHGDRPKNGDLGIGIGHATD